MNMNTTPGSIPHTDVNLFFGTIITLLLLVVYHDSSLTRNKCVGVHSF